MPNNFIQIFLLSTSVVSQYLQSYRNYKIRRPAYIITLASQPVWFVAMIKTHNWGVAILSFWFAACAIRGIVTHWSK